ncbi:MAG: hypothetical protein WAO19_06655 [Candidatus Kryptoniota bacterium]
MEHFECAGTLYASDLNGDGEFSVLVIVICLGHKPLEIASNCDCDSNFLMEAS